MDTEEYITSFVASYAILKLVPNINPDVLRTSIIFLTPKKLLPETHDL